MPSLLQQSNNIFLLLLLLSVLCQEMKYIQQALSPVLMCCAASSGDIKTLEDMLSQVRTCLVTCILLDSKTKGEGGRRGVPVLVQQGAYWYLQEKLLKCSWLQNFTLSKIPTAIAALSTFPKTILNTYHCSLITSN